MKIARILLFILIMFSAGFANAQHDLIRGYIINNNQDTIYGYLKYDPDRKLSNRVIFSSGRKDEKSIIYHPDEIKAFAFSNGRTFKTFTQFEDTVPVFAKKIVTGKVNMYVQRIKESGKFKAILYRSDTNFSVILTPPNKYELNDESKTYVYTPKKYIGKIRNITNNQKTDKELDAVSYRVKTIKKYILSYNEMFEDSFPVSAYKDSTNLTFDISAGIPINFKPGELHWRVSAYGDKTIVDKYPNISYRMGISYRYWSTNEIDSSKSISDYRNQYISILPLGIRYQLSNKKVIPYGYLAMGMIIIINDQYDNIWSFQPYNKERSVALTFGVNLGIGVKFRINSVYLFAEITPAIAFERAIFFNLGVSF